MPVVPDLTLTEEFFLLSHDDYTGKPCLNREVLGLGLAGGLLAQLLVARRITVTGDGIGLRDPRPYRQPAPDFVVQEIYWQANQHAVYSAVEWVKYLRDKTYPLVAQELVRRRVVRQENGGLLGRSKRYVAVDAVHASRPRVRLVYFCQRLELLATELDEQTAGLAGLAIATRLESVIATTAGIDPGQGLRAMMARLPGDTRTVLAGVDAAVTADALAVRGR